MSFCSQGMFRGSVPAPLWASPHVSHCISYVIVSQMSPLLFFLNNPVTRQLISIRFSMRQRSPTYLDRHVRPWTRESTTSNSEVLCVARFLRGNALHIKLSNLTSLTPLFKVGRAYQDRQDFCWRTGAILAESPSCRPNDSYWYSGNWTQVQWVQVRRLYHWTTAETCYTRL